MTLISSDGNQFVSIGSSTIWRSLYSTIITRVDDFFQSYQETNSFFEEYGCTPDKSITIATQLEEIKDRLSRIKPELAVYDWKHPEISPPWHDHVSPAITSCTELYTTENGLHLLDELIKLLEYSAKMNTAIISAA